MPTHAVIWSNHRDTPGNSCTLVRRYEVWERRGLPFAEFSLREGVECFLDDSAGFVGQSSR
jgi:hypothetical protein